MKRLDTGDSSPWSSGPSLSSSVGKIVKGSLSLGQKVTKLAVPITQNGDCAFGALDQSLRLPPVRRSAWWRQGPKEAQVSACRPLLAHLSAEVKQRLQQLRNGVTPQLLPALGSFGTREAQTPKGYLIGGTGEKSRRWPHSDISMINGPTFFDKQDGAATLFGRVGPKAAVVTIATHGGIVTATMTSGWYFAWSPISQNNLGEHAAHHRIAVAKPDNDQHVETGPAARSTH